MNRYLQLRDRLELGHEGRPVPEGSIARTFGTGSRSKTTGRASRTCWCTSSATSPSTSVRSSGGSRATPTTCAATQAPVRRAGPRSGSRTGSGATREEAACVSASSSAAPAPGSNRVHVGLITKRTDAVVYFRKHYGSGVKVEVEATEESVVGVLEGRQLRDRRGRDEPDASTGRAAEATSSSGSRSPSSRTASRWASSRDVHGLQHRGSALRAAGRAQRAAGNRAVIDAATTKRTTRPDRPRRASVSGEGGTDCARKGDPRPRERGLPADPAYVQQRLNSGRLFTAAEERWLLEVGTFDNDDKVETYCAATAPTYSGSVVLATYPAKPTVLYRFVRNTAKHEAAIKRRSRHPKQIRTETVTFSTADIDRSRRRSRTMRPRAKASSTAMATRASPSRGSSTATRPRSSS